MPSCADKNSEKQRTKSMINFMAVQSSRCRPRALHRDITHDKRVTGILNPAESLGAPEAQHGQRGADLPRHASVPQPSNKKIEWITGHACTDASAKLNGG